jgi:hypothetical protein
MNYNELMSYKEKLALDTQVMHRDMDIYSADERTFNS